MEFFIKKILRESLEYYSASNAEPKSDKYIIGIKEDDFGFDNFSDLDVLDIPEPPKAATKTEKFDSLVTTLSAKKVVGKDDMYEFSNGGAKLVFKPTSNKYYVELELVEVRGERGKGYAKDIISKFLGACDSLGLGVELTISPRDKQTDFGKLVSLYKNFGFNFKNSYGFDSDFEMIRPPKKK